MALNADQITAKNFKEFYEQIRPYLGGTLGYADCPVGTILAFGGITIPNGWFACQGQELLIEDYPVLYSVIGDNFGTASAETKFKLPDLRGEFLRGAGENGHTNQGDGGIIGAHQDGTEFPHYFVERDAANGVAISGYSASNENHITEADSTYGSSVSCLRATTKERSTASWAVGQATDFTARPTNTSVNFIIKAKRVDAPSDFKDYVNEQMSYSTEEKMVGTWIDGKPLYQKTIVINGDFGSSEYYYDFPTAQNLLIVDGYFDGSYSNKTYQIPINYSEQSYNAYVIWDITNKRIVLKCNGFATTKATLTIRYTKTTD